MPSSPPPRRRMIVAFVEVETAQDRAFRHAATNMSLDAILAEGGRPKPKPYHDEGHTPEGRLRYWCAADMPDADGTSSAIAAVYRTNGVDEDAKCEDCGVRIRELQKMFSRA